MRICQLAPLALAAALILPISTAAAQACKTARGQPEVFDFHLLSLSWAPAFCATDSGKGDKEQCANGGTAGFTVHGLWPQYRDGGWPQCCAVAGGISSTDMADGELLRIMPGQALRRHEWQKHGTCAAPSATAYFDQIRQAVRRHGLGPATDKLGARVRVSELKAGWPGMPADAITVRCEGRRLREVRLCLDRSLSAIPCPASITRQDNCPGTVEIAKP